jgi:hypothetical protein
MPKEQINYPHPYRTGHSLPGLPEDPDQLYMTADPALFVRWHAAGHDSTGHVQLSISEFEKAAPAEYEALENDTHLVNPLKTVAEHYCPPLTRSELNDLIRVLRKARDQAYGRDE